MLQDGETALQKAAREGHGKIVQILRDYSVIANIDRNMVTNPYFAHGNWVLFSLLEVKTYS